MAHNTETSVKWYCPLMGGLPAYGSGTGQTIDLLDAILVNGFGEQTFDLVEVTSGVARAHRAAGHNFLFDQIVQVQGANPTGLNGEKRVTAVDSAWIEFPADNIPDGYATGTITIKTPPIGWEKVFSATNKAVYRSLHPSSPKSYFKIDASGTDWQHLAFNAYEYMSSIDSGSDLWAAEHISAPRNLNITGYPSVASALIDDAFYIIGDARTVYITWVASRGGSAGNSCYSLYGFGEFLTWVPGYSKNEFLSGNGYYPGGTSYPMPGGGMWSTKGSETNARIRRTPSGFLGPTLYPFRQVNDSSGYGGPHFPSIVDNGFTICDNILRVTGTGDGQAVGKARGGYWVQQDSPFTWVCPPITVTGISGLEGRTIAVAPYSTYTPSYDGQIYSGRVAFDITGPWG